MGGSNIQDAQFTCQAEITKIYISGIGSKHIEEEATDQCGTSQKCEKTEESGSNLSPSTPCWRKPGHVGKGKA